jgi:hypothetical protein
MLKYLIIVYVGVIFIGCSSKGHVTSKSGHYYEVSMDTCANYKDYGNYIKCYNSQLEFTYIQYPLSDDAIAKRKQRQKEKELEDKIDDAILEDRMIRRYTPMGNVMSY